VIYELDHWWGSDLSVDSSGDLALVSGTVRGEQRVLRRLLTNSADDTQDLPGDYLWDRDYGASLPRRIGRPLDVGGTSATIRSTMALEDAVAQTPPPQIAVSQLAASPNGFSVQVAYNDAPSNSPVVLSFDVAL
jgi:hypothetical protein